MPRILNRPGGAGAPTAPPGYAHDSNVTKTTWRARDYATTRRVNRSVKHVIIDCVNAALFTL